MEPTVTDELPPGADAIARIMGTTTDGAAATLREWYGDAIAREVLSIGRIWENEAVLSRRERSFVAIAALVALGAKERLRIHVGGALRHGATAAEIEEVILTMMVYAGHGRSTEAIEVARATIAAEQSRMGGG